MIIWKNKVLRTCKGDFENRRMSENMPYVISKVSIKLHLFKSCGATVDMQINKAEKKILQQIIIHARTSTMKEMWQINRNQTVVQ